MHNNVKTTANNEEVAHHKPLYYSFSTINDKEQKIFATEEEVRTGD